MDNTENTAARPHGRWRRIAGPFRTLIQPGLGWRARSLAAGKVMLLLGTAGALLLVIYTLLLIPFTPSIADLRKTRNEQPSTLISVDGQLLATYKRFNREWVPLSRIAPSVPKALIA
ncbi:MAG: penicillin-binding protein, partial [Burkholderiaceae bacterium]